MLVFWRFGTFICKVAFFLAIVASHLTGIARGPLLLTLNGIVSCHWGGVFFLSESFLLLFFAIGLGKLIRTGQSGGFAIGRLCFLGPELLSAKFLYSGLLGLHL